MADQVRKAYLQKNLPMSHVEDTIAASMWICSLQLNRLHLFFLFSQVYFDAGFKNKALTRKNIHTICTIQNEAFVLVSILNLLLFF